jgi:hypothetical protein
MSQILEHPVLDTPKHPKQITRKFSDILLHTKFKQCYGHEANQWFHNGEPVIQERCAVGVLMSEFFGVDYANDSSIYKTEKREELQKILIEHGLIIGDIIVKNDHERQTFSQIADFLESVGL